MTQNATKADGRLLSLQHRLQLVLKKGRRGSSENSGFMCVLEGNDALSLSSAKITRLCALASVMSMSQVRIIREEIVSIK